MGRQTTGRIPDDTIWCWKAPTDLTGLQLWNTLQAMPEYKDQTTLLITTDHGRGSGREEWKEKFSEFDKLAMFVWERAKGF
jgi:hypothetical protein